MEITSIKPDIIYSSLTAFGDKGPYKNRPGFELIIQALTGLIDITSPLEGPPAKIQIQIVDLCGGIFQAFATLQVAAEKINSVEEAFEDPGVVATEMVKTMQHATAGEVKVLDKPWHLSLTPGGLRMPPPGFGQHSSEILLESGFSLSEVEALKDKKVVAGT